MRVNSSQPQFAQPANQRANRTNGLIAFALYAVIAIIFFGRPVLSDPREIYIGSASPDSSLFMWLLVWWPYAITHHINPFITRLIWVPDGYNLAWTHFMFAPAIVGWPLTQFLGPVFSWNILCLAALALNAWSGYLLCQNRCHSFWPAFVGGYLFGFSPYVLGHLLGHLPLITVFPQPLAVYLVLLRIDGRISSARFTLLLACVALFQFLCSPEIFATSVVLGSMMIILALGFTPAQSRWILLRVCGLVSCALGIAALLSAPFWYYAIAIDYQHAPINSPEFYSADLLGFVIPNSLLLAGRISLWSSISQSFGRNLFECNYLGLPLIVVVLVFALANYRNRSAMLVVLALVVAAILSLGPRLHIGGTESIYLPWWFAGRLPLINQALPIRLSMYVFLAAAVIVSTLLAAPGRRIRRWLLVAVGVISLVPDLGFPIWSTRVDTPRFFADGTYKRYIARNQTVLIVPYGSRGNSMLWQAVTGMYFKMAGGNCSYTPAEYKYWPVLRNIFGDGPLMPNFKQQLEGFLEAHDVDVIVVAHHAREVTKPFDIFPGQFRRDATHFFAPLGVVPVEAADVLVWRLPKYRNLTVDKRGQLAGIGGKVVVSSVSQSGTILTVNGSGFSLLTVINLFNKQGAKVVNLGGLGWEGWLKIPILSVSQNKLTFTIPPDAKPGISYVQAINPPYTSSTNSGNGPGGWFILVQPGP